MLPTAQQPIGHRQCVMSVNLVLQSRVVKWEHHLVGVRAELRAAEYFLQLMATTREGQPFDAAAVRSHSLVCRRWLEQELQRAPRGRWDKTLVITHFAPSLRSADPRYGAQPGTASFCNADDDLVARADLWLHGHLHCRHDYTVDRAGRAPARVVCHARGLEHKGEHVGHDGLRLINF